MLCSVSAFTHLGSFLIVELSVLVFVSVSVSVADVVLISSFFVTFRNLRCSEIAY
jgi:hypothetical protein